ncbi:MAG: aminotransferase class V-fold PLP-dependent enzyme [Geminicoccaceae bacterium]
MKRGVYRLADAATNAFAEARARIAAYLNAASPDEVVFTSGATLAINLAAHVLSPRLGPGDEIVVSELEHHSNIVPWQLAAERTGARVRAIPVTDDGRLAYDRLDEAIGRRTRIVAVTHCSNVTGALTDLARIRDAARAVGALLLVDGAQRAPHGPLDVQALGCDLYAFSGHKMFGSTGAGALWIRGDLARDLPPFLGGGEMIARVSIERSTWAKPPHRFEAGTPAIGPCLAMGAAADWLARQDWAQLEAHELSLTERLLDGLSAIPAVRVLGPTGLQGPRRRRLRGRRRPRPRRLPDARRPRRRAARRPSLRPAADGAVRRRRHRPRQLRPLQRRCRHRRPAQRARGHGAPAGVTCPFA